MKLLLLNLFILSLLSCVALKQNKIEKLQYFDMQHQSLSRKYAVYIPQNLSLKKEAPLLFALHGGGGNGKQLAKHTRGKFNELADKDNFIVVYPYGYEKSWNDGRSSDVSYALKNKFDDVGFILKIIDELSSNYNIDKSRIFSTGISNGGFMTSRLLCDRPDIFRGGAIITATISEDYFTKCHPSHQTGVLVMNGTSDKLVPYDGGEITVFKKKRGKIISTNRFIEFWKEKNQCSTMNEIINLPDLKNEGTKVAIHSFSNCKNQGALVLYQINGGGHTWPGATQNLPKKIVGNTCKEINACDVIWDFFKNLN